MQIGRDETIADAFKKLNANKSGVLFVTDGDRRVIGVVTDGDIRRHLLDDSDTTAPIATSMNQDFVRVSEGISREQVLKLLDQRIRQTLTAGQLIGRDADRVRDHAIAYDILDQL